MASTTRRPGRQRPEGPPQETVASQPDVTPVAHYQTDHSFTLQAIMELQKTTGQLTSSIEALNRTLTDLGTKQESNQSKIDTRLDRFGDTLSSITHKLYAAGAVLVVLVAVGGFIVDKAWDLMASRLTVTIDNPSTQTAPPPAQKKQ